LADSMGRWKIVMLKKLFLASAIVVSLLMAVAPRHSEAGPKASSQFDLDAGPDIAAPDPLTPPEATEPAPIAPGAAPAAPGAAPAVVSSPADVDPIVAQVRQRLADLQPPHNAAERDDRAGLASFYASGNGQPVWTSKDRYTTRAVQVMDEIRKAADWGLDASAFDLPSPLPDQPTIEALADAEIKVGLAVLKYGRFARGGRLDPSSLSHIIDQKPRVYDPKSVMDAIAASNAPDAYLRSLHPTHPQFERLRQLLLATRNVSGHDHDSVLGSGVKIPLGAKIRPGEKHPHIALIRQRLAVSANADSPTSYDELLVEAVKDYQRQHDLEATGIIDNRTRTALNGTPRQSAGENVQRILVNMERWRWMPDDLGKIYVWDSVTEQMTRVVIDGKVVLSEKIVVGKYSTPTPIFSANMQFIIFHPEWGVPDGIKTNELWPMLRRASASSGWFFDFGSDAGAVLKRYDLHASLNGQYVNPDSVNWSSVDIRRFQFTQPPGGTNVLGVVKFRFPNKHDVYMHDTPERHLFNGGTRAFSHGCMRVQNPIRLAEVLLSHDKGWSADTVQGLVNHGGTNEITLTNPVPVHITYFTIIVDDDGKVQHRDDIYGLDGRIISALAGRSKDMIAHDHDPAVRAEHEVRARTRVRQRYPAVAAQPPFNPFSGH
jgi:murein L,D-transpeptidase YcbB/YkuD